MAQDDPPRHVVVDVGNSLIKWGLCGAAAGSAVAALPPADPASWRRQLDTWRLNGPLRWTVSGVHPPCRQRLVDWLVARGDAVEVVVAPEQLPLKTALPQPEKVGID